MQCRTPLQSKRKVIPHEPVWKQVVEAEQTELLKRAEEEAAAVTKTAEEAAIKAKKDLENSGQKKETKAAKAKEAKAAAIVESKKAKAAHTTAVTALNKLKKEANGIAQKRNKAKKDALKAKGLAEKNKKGEESAIKATNVAAGAVEAAIVVEETAKRNADEIVAKAEKMRQELGLGEEYTGPQAVGSNM